MTEEPDIMSARLNLSISVMLGRNIRATFKHINARVVREFGSGLVPDAPCPVDRFTRETIEGGQCWRDPRAQRLAPQIDFPTCYFDEVKCAAGIAQLKNYRKAE